MYVCKFVRIVPMQLDNSTQLQCIKFRCNVGCKADTGPGACAQRIWGARPQWVRARQVWGTRQDNTAGGGME